jgi:hypothetical protein
MSAPWSARPSRTAPGFAPKARGYTLSGASVLDLKFAAFRAKSELQIQGSTLEHGLASVLIDSEVRPARPQAHANFGIGTLGRREDLTLTATG